MKLSTKITFLLLMLSLPPLLFGMLAIQKEQEFCKPISATAIKVIPQYIYENCNQHIRHTWTADEFKILKEKAATVTKEEIRRETTDEKSFLYRCELYDWIHALNFIETDLLQNPTKGITVAEMQKIHARLTRLSGNKGGTYRDEDIWWPKLNVGDTEHFMDWYIKENDARMIAGTDTVKIDSEGNMDAASLQVVLLIAEKNANSLRTVDGRIPQIDHRKLIEWERFCAGSKPKTVHYGRWVEYYFHAFPRVREIDSLVEARAHWSRQPLHPIVLSSRMWYKLVEIHPWSLANKRMGKAVAIKLLLENGYYPPIIDGEDSKKYVTILKEGFEDDNGYNAFTAFINDVMTKTVQKLHARPHCSVCTKPSDKRCGQCKDVYYCSIEHQKSDWATHKLACTKKT